MCGKTLSKACRSGSSTYTLALIYRYGKYVDRIFSFYLPPPRRLFSSLFVCLLANLRKNFQTDLHEIFREGWQWANKQMVKFRRRSLTDLPDGTTDIATLVRRALAEVCTVPVLLVLFYFLYFILQLYNLENVR